VVESPSQVSELWAAFVVRSMIRYPIECVVQPRNSHCCHLLDQIQRQHLVKTDGNPNNNFWDGQIPSKVLHIFKDTSPRERLQYTSDQINHDSIPFLSSESQRPFLRKCQYHPLFISCCCSSIGMAKLWSSRCKCSGSGRNDRSIPFREGP
jgi:hypothetical protein